jgi:hypothetical protein
VDDEATTGDAHIPYPRVWTGRIGAGAVAPSAHCNNPCFLLPPAEAEFHSNARVQSDLLGQVGSTDAKDSQAVSR